jgi:phage gp46-like protein
MSDFSITATNLSDPKGAGANVVSPVQRPNVDNAPVLGALSNIADVFAKGLNLQKKEDAEARKQSILKRYSEEIASVTSGFESGQLTADRTTAMTQSITRKYLSGFSEYSGEITDISKSMRGETAISEAEQKVKDARETRNRNIASAEKDGFAILEGAPREVVDATINAHQVGVKSRQEFTDLVQRNTEFRNQSNFDQAIADRQTKETSFRLINNIVGANLEDYQQTAVELSRRIKSGAMDAESARLFLGNKLANINSALVTAGRTNPELAAPYAKIFSDMNALGQQLLDPKTSAESVSSQLKELIAKTQLMAVQKDQKVLAAVAVSQLFRDNPANSINVLGESTKAFVLMQQASVDSDPRTVPNIIEGPKEVETEVLGMLKESLTGILKGGHPQQAIAELQAGNTVNQVMKQVSGLIDKGTVKPEELLPILNFFASSAFGEFAGNKHVSSATALAAKKVLQNIVEPKIIREISERIATPIREGSKTTIKDILDIRFENGGVTFSLKSGVKELNVPGGNAYAAGVLRDFKGAETLINRVIKAGTHLEQSKDYKKTWEDNRHNFFPDYFPAPKEKPTIDVSTEEKMKAQLTATDTGVGTTASALQGILKDLANGKLTEQQKKDLAKALEGMSN